jgi:hypothetical protein
MLIILTISILRSLLAFFRSREEQAIVELALRQQLSIYAQQQRRPRLSPLDRAFWVALSKLWPRWKERVIVVRPETVVRWHRQGFRKYWRLISTPGPGRPPISEETKSLIIHCASTSTTTTTSASTRPSAMLRMVETSKRGRRRAPRSQDRRGSAASTTDIAGAMPRDQQVPRPRSALRRSRMNIENRQVRCGSRRCPSRASSRADTQIHAVYPHRKHLSSKVRRFVDHLATHFGPRPYWDEGLPV